MVIPGSFAVLLLGQLKAWAPGPAARRIGQWLAVGVATAVYVPLFAMVPLVFLPWGRVFDRALVDARQRGVVTRHWPARSATRRSRPRALVELAALDPLAKQRHLLGWPGAITRHPPGGHLVQDGISVLADRGHVPQVECPAHCGSVAVGEQRPDVAREAG